MLPRGWVSRPAGRCRGASAFTVMLALSAFCLGVGIFATVYELFTLYKG